MKDSLYFFLSKLILFSTSFLIFYIPISNCTYECHSGVTDLKKYLGSNTPYRYLDNPNTRDFQYADCKPERIIGFVRHGVRTPGWKVIQRMRNDLPLMRDYILSNIFVKYHPGLLCDFVAEDLLMWEFKVEHDGNEKFLTQEGKNELTGLAERLQAIYPKLLPSEYSNTTYFFKFTGSQRAANSARYFTVGLFGSHKSLNISFAMDDGKDIVLRFYHLCNRWVQAVKKNPKGSMEYWDYVYGDEVTKVCEGVSDRLGLKDVLSYADINLFHSACSYETAWNSEKISPWCSVFSEFDFEVLQYADDLKHFWVDGYGHDLNYNIACPAIRDIFSFLVLNSTTHSPKAAFYFSHSGTILKILAHLGLYKDPFKLTARTANDKREVRQWRTSDINAFASNLLFVAYDCDVERKILTLHQELPVIIPGCPKYGDLCPVSLLLNIFKESLNNCQYEQMCTMPSLKKNRKSK